jgi:YD repeat-containing protein
MAGPVYRLIRMDDRNHNTLTLTYASGLLTGITDVYGRALTFTSDNRNKLVAIVDPLGRTTQFTYDVTGTRLQDIGSHASLGGVISTLGRSSWWDSVLRGNEIARAMATSGDSDHCFLAHSQGVRNTLEGISRYAAKYCSSA